jgi:tetratricopeptide (TPR) repeat protein
MPETPPPDAAARAQQRQLTISEILERVKTLTSAGDYDEAMTGLTYVLRAEPENFNAKLLLAKLYEARRDFMNARTTYLDLHKAQPGNFDINLGLGRIFVMIQYWRQAPRYLEEADKVARPDQKAEVKVLLAMAYRGSGELALALKAAEAAVTADSSNFDALAVVVDVRLALEQYDQAAGDARALVEVATRAVESKRGDVALLRNLAGAHDALINVLRLHYTTLYARDAAGKPTDELLPGREKDAAAFLQQIVDVMVRAAEVQHQLAYHDALVLAEKSATLDPQNPAVLEKAALLLLNTDQTEVAVKVFQRILEIDPSHTTAIRELNRLNAPLTSQPAPSDPTTQPATPQ